MDARTELVRIPRVAPMVGALAVTVLAAGAAGYAARGLTDRPPTITGHLGAPAAAHRLAGVAAGDRWYLDPIAAPSSGGASGDRWYLDPSATPAADGLGGDRWYLDLSQS